MKQEIFNAKQIVKIQLFYFEPYTWVVHKKASLFTRGGYYNMLNLPTSSYLCGDGKDLIECNGIELKKIAGVFCEYPKIIVHFSDRSKKKIDFKTEELADDYYRNLLKNLESIITFPKTMVTL